MERREKYVKFKDAHGTWDFKISEGWLTEELWRVHIRSYFSGVASGVMVGMAILAIIQKVFS